MRMRWRTRTTECLSATGNPNRKDGLTCSRSPSTTAPEAPQQCGAALMDGRRHGRILLQGRSASCRACAAAVDRLPVGRLGGLYYTASLVLWLSGDGVPAARDLARLRLRRHIRLSEVGADEARRCLDEVEPHSRVWLDIGDKP